MVEQQRVPRPRPPKVIRKIAPGMQMEGKVRSVTDFGAFVDVGVGRDGLVHVSEISRRSVTKPQEVLKEGQTVTVWIKELDRERNRIGLTMIDDLGVWWEQTTDYPIPLGAIIAKRSLGDKTIGEIEAAIRKSLLFAFSDPDAPLAFMKQHAGEMDIDVMRQHVELYVNNYSLDYGDDGIKAITYLIECADEQGLLEGY